MGESTAQTGVDVEVKWIGDLLQIIYDLTPNRSPQRIFWRNSRDRRDLISDAAYIPARIQSPPAPPVYDLRAFLVPLHPPATALDINYYSYMFISTAPALNLIKFSGFALCWPSERKHFTIASESLSASLVNVELPSRFQLYLALRTG